MKNQNKIDSFDQWLGGIGGNLPSKQAMTNKRHKLRLFVNVVIVFLVLILVATGLRFVENKFFAQEAWEIEEAQAEEIDYQLLDLPASPREEFDSGYLGTRYIDQVASSENKISFGSIFRSIFGIKTAQAAEVLNPKYTAVKIIQSERGTIEMTAGSTKQITIGFKNTGKKTWHTDGSTYVSLYASSPSSRVSPFEHTSWKKDGFYSRVARLSNNKIRPGYIGLFTIILQAPEEAGTYLEDYKLAVEDYCWIDGSAVEFEIKVTARPAKPPKATSILSYIPAAPATSEDSSAGTSGSSPALEITPVLQMIEEPTLRVGLHSAPESAIITSAKPYEIKDLNGSLLASRKAGAKSTAVWDRVNARYLLQIDGQSQVLSGPMRFIGGQDDQIFEITNYERRLGDRNFNKYRGIIEFRYSSSSDTVWLINELGLEDYCKGIDETSDISPMEFQKALIVAARTYALHHYNRGTKHASDHFTVDALYDQIYRGVVAEQSHPNVSVAVQETRGMIVTYDNEPVLTPYFSQSDGRTRDWQEVWYGGPYPWLVSVPDPHNQGQELLGHGVGMSARGALKMAARDDSNFVEILQYYYQGTKVQRIYD